MLVLELTPGELIRRARRDENGHDWITQAELAEKVGVDPSTVSRWERNKSRPDFLEWKRLVTALHQEELSDLRILPWCCFDE